MKKAIIFLLITYWIGAVSAFAQSTDNSDFNPFPQMEQDFNNTNDQGSQPADQPSDQQQNDDQWPPPTPQTNQVPS